MATRKSFILYHNYFDHLSFLTAEQLGELIRAIFLYDRDGILPVGLPPVSAMAFSFIRSDLDRDRESYLSACEAKRVYGKKGGRPKKEKLSSNDEKTICFFEKPKKPDNDVDHDVDVDVDVDNDVDVGVEVENENAVVVDGVCVVEVGEPLALRATSVSDGTHTETKEKEISFLAPSGKGKTQSGKSGGRNAQRGENPRRDNKKGCFIQGRSSPGGWLQRLGQFTFSPDKRRVTVPLPMI